MEKIIIVHVGSVFQGTKAHLHITPSNPRMVDEDTFKLFLEYYGWKDPDDRKAAWELLLEEREAVRSTRQQGQVA